MPRDGSGVFTLPAGTQAVSNTLASSSNVNSRFSDLESDANTARPIVAGGTGATSVAAARAALGLVIGTNVQAYSPTLAELAAQYTNNTRSFPYRDTDGSMGEARLTLWSIAFLDDGNAGAARASLELGTVATLDVGTSAGNAVQLDGSGRLPAIDASQLTNLPNTASGLGVNQTWQSVTGDRAVGTIYQNATGAPIQVAIQYGGGFPLFEVDTTNAFSGDQVLLQQGDGANNNKSVFAVIPNGHHYRFSGAATVIRWSELR